MRRLRDVFYISANFEESYYIYYGMEFHEFISCCPVVPNNIMVADGKFITNHFNGSWFLETACGKDEILELSKEDIYGLGNFHWIDYNNEAELNSCTPEEKAEVLYLSHFGKPLKSAFNSRINNNFVYLAHDDGWFCKLYCRDMSVYKDIMANKIIESISTNKRRKIYPMTEEIKNKLLELTRKGLLIDFSNVYRDERMVCLNFYVVGHYQDMDEMYHDLERNRNRVEIKGTLKHANKTWRINIWE